MALEPVFDVGAKKLASARKMHSKKLTPDQVDEIKKLYLGVNVTQATLAKQFNVSPAAINHALHTQWGEDKSGAHGTTYIPYLTKRIHKSVALDTQLEIRTKYQTGKYTQLHLCAAYGLAVSTVNGILRKRWNPKTGTLTVIPPMRVRRG
jgi:DNA-binding XRE family transcriptional regulator